MKRCGFGAVFLTVEMVLCSDGTGEDEVLGLEAEDSAGAGGSRCCTVGLSLVHRRSCREDRLRLLVLRRSGRPEMLLELRSPD